MYNGEANIAQGDLTLFLETARELKVKGLQGDLQGIGQKEKQMADYSAIIDDETDPNMKTMRTLLEK